MQSHKSAFLSEKRSTLAITTLPFLKVLSHWSRKISPKIRGTLKSLPKVVSKKRHQEECIPSAKTAKRVSSCVASQVLQVTDNLPSFPSKAEFSQIERETSKPPCRLHRSWNRALANRSLPAQQTRHQDKNCVQLHYRARGGGGGGSATSEGKNDNFFLQNEGLFKASTGSLVIQLHAREKWRSCGNHSYQKIRLECTQVTIDRNRSMASQKGK